MDSYSDVLVAGGGNAALCAAIAARRRGASVTLVERASREWRGGNSKYTRNVRVAHGLGDPLMPGEYTDEEFLQDLGEVTGPGTDLELARMFVSRSRSLPSWMTANGVRWQPPLHGTLQLSRTNRFFLGGGKALLNGYYRLAESLGVKVVYGGTVSEVTLDGGRCAGAVVAADGERRQVHSGALVVATGGFEANLEWLREYHGDRVDGFVVRGSACNDGLLLRHLLDRGAMARGAPAGFHAVAVDARSPRFEGGIVTRVDSVPFSIMVNRQGRRFADEGEDLWPKRYATWGGLVAEQPGQRAFSIFDSRVLGSFIPGAYPPVVGNSVEELAAATGLPQGPLLETVGAYNRSLAGGAYDPARLDGCSTAGLAPPKSHWALPIDRPPYYCFELVPGITFTYLGVAVDARARVLRGDGEPFENVFAAGEIMAGNVLLRGYLAGFGMTIGTVSGILAGEEAASHALA
ncbi:MAG: FAD-dependent tricarballylate dehydrogenase TcuA [Candidatus Dormibacteraeota bacterium]|nr:FAD-dependent tricarballylate dehydrogenase TcuA [Candidatus Dormibacteraeota bacterium]